MTKAVEDKTADTSRKMPKASAIVAIAFLALSAFAAFTLTRHRYNEPDIGDAASAAKQVLKQKWGVQTEGLRLSAAGYMLDFRFRVLDPNKAVPLLDRANKPYLLDPQSGAKLIVPAPPKVGSLRQKSRAPKRDKVYFVMFSNPGRFIKSGQKVTVVIGDFKAENLVVQ